MREERYDALGRVLADVHVKEVIVEIVIALKQVQEVIESSAANGDSDTKKAALVTRARYPGSGFGSIWPGQTFSCGPW